MMRMMSGTKSRNLSGFLQSEFSRVSSSVAGEIAKNAGVAPDTSLKDIDQAMMEKIYAAIGNTKIMAPPTNCVAPIGEAAMLEGLKALLVQQHMASEEAKLRRKKLEGPAPKVGDEQAAEAAESKITEAIEAVTVLARRTTMATAVRSMPRKASQTPLSSTRPASSRSLASRVLSRR